MSNDPTSPEDVPASAAASAAVTTPAAVTVPTPDHRDMYVLVLGLIVGLVLSPWMMGRFMDSVSYDRWYFGGGEKVTAYHEFMKTHVPQTREKDTELLDRLAASGVTPEAVAERRAALEEEARAERLPFVEAISKEREAHQTWQRGLMVALVVAVIVLMLMEPVFEIAGPMAPIRRRLVTGRYGLIAVWVAFALAKPHALVGIPWIFGLTAILITLVAAMVPTLISRVAAEAREEEA